MLTEVWWKSEQNIYQTLLFLPIHTKRVWLRKTSWWVPHQTSHVHFKTIAFVINQFFAQNNTHTIHEYLNEKLYWEI